MSDMIDTLQQLQQLRQRYQRNINALNALTLSEEAFPGVSALQMANHAGYQRHIQRLIDWQNRSRHWLISRLAIYRHRCNSRLAVKKS